MKQIPNPISLAADRGDISTFFRLQSTVRAGTLFRTDQCCIVLRIQEARSSFDEKTIRRLRDDLVFLPQLLCGGIIRLIIDKCERRLVWLPPTRLFGHRKSRRLDRMNTPAYE